jgi:ATP-dependent DNA helicase RecG
MKNHSRLIALVDELRALPDETEWVEFKKDNINPEVVGKRISALSNGARLKDKPKGYMLWGIQDGTHKVVSTKFKGNNHPAKGQPFAFWLTKSLEPGLSVDFQDVDHPDGRVVLLEIDPATGTPTKFKGWLTSASQRPRPRWRITHILRSSFGRGSRHTLGKRT